MGDPRKTRKKYSTPRHPWEKVRIEKEAEIIKEYALATKKEIWKVNSKLKNYKDQAKRLSSSTSAQSEKEKELLMQKLISIGVLKEEERMNSILTLKLEDLMERRLQTLVQRKGFARSMKQARQFITHGHVMINGKIITSPSYIVRKSEEGGIGFRVTSGLSNAEHPERQIAKAVDVSAVPLTEKEEKAAEKREEERNVTEEKPKEKEEAKA